MTETQVRDKRHYTFPGTNARNIKGRDNLHSSGQKPRKIKKKARRNLAGKKWFVGQRVLVKNYQLSNASQGEIKKIIQPILESNDYQ